MSEFRRVAITFLGVTFWVLVAVPAAESRVLGSASDSGSLPIPFLFSDDIQRTRSLSLTITTSPSAPLYQGSNWSIHCQRGFDSRSIEYPLPGAGTYTAGPTLRNGTCLVSASASFADIQQPGSISITAYGESKRKRKKR